MMISDDNASQEDRVLRSIENLLQTSLENLEYERDKFKTLTDESANVLQNIRNTLFSFLTLGFSIILGLPFILSEEYDIEPLWLIGILFLLVLVGSIIYVITNIYGNKLLGVLTEIDRTYYDGVVTLSLMKVFLASRVAKVKQNLTLEEFESLYVYLELLVGGIYCSLDDKYIRSISKIPTDRLRKSLQSSSPLDSAFVNELCNARRKDIESRNFPSISSILHLSTNFPEIVERLFIRRFYSKCDAVYAAQSKSSL
ncbi:MAG: hypothetical protein WBX01_07975 [Nitrososphaeraceae archaeon]